MSYPLPLTPLPRFVSHPSADLEPTLLQGFVDDAVVDRMVADTAVGERLNPARFAPVREDLVLSSSEDDYAGWHGGISPRLSVHPAFSVPLSLVAAPSEPLARRAAPPSMDEPGLEPSYRSGHRWWLAATAGAVASLTFAAVILSASMRVHDSESEYVLGTTPPRVPAPMPTAVQPPPAAPKEITSRAEP
ncbi:MAG: hypothetical protein J0M04_22320 [Verrucomicrobia bacterium]|nr:hypothetical protein [Verrucomicrobiota bacterium]